MRDGDSRVYILGGRGTHYQHAAFSKFFPVVLNGLNALQCVVLKGHALSDLHDPACLADGGRLLEFYAT